MKFAFNATVWALATIICCTQIVSAQAQETSAPSPVVDVTSPAPSVVSPAPSSSLADPSCSAFEVCAGLGLGGDCCPTVEDVFLDCCFGITPIPAQSSGTTAPSSTPAPSIAPVTPAPSKDLSQLPIIFSLTTVDAQGCMEAVGSDDEDEVVLRACDISRTSQMFMYDGTHIRTMLNETKCLQAGLEPMPDHDKWIRVMPCDEGSSLQIWSWDPSGGPIVLTNPGDFCMFPQGTFATIGDRVVVRNCAVAPFVGSLFAWEIYV